MSFEVPVDENIIETTIENEMQQSYIDYAMSVIVSRALPDVRDGLKPVQRRIIHGMNELGLSYNKKENKCARIVGDVMGRYHPHGDSSIYAALVRMSQDFSYRYPLIRGQGNFGNIDLPPAAMRYTEAKLERLSEEMVKDIKKRTVDFTDNYDNSLQEPVVMPARIPNLLINGTQGIAVGLATSIPPHNIGEVLRAVIALVDNPEIPIESSEGSDEDCLLNYIKAPDFPTRGLIYGYSGVRSMYLTGKGRIILRGKIDLVEAKKKGERDKLVITELPYQVSRSKLLDHIVQLAKDKRILGIHDAANESGRKTKIVLELKKDANPDVLMNKLFKYTPLQSTVSGNMVALDKGRPVLFNLKKILEKFVDHRQEVIIRRSQYELEKAQDRIHILMGLKKALDNIDRVIEIIRSSRNSEIAQQQLISEFDFSDKQASAILSMRLAQLTGMEREKLLEEIEQLNIKIADLQDILARNERRKEIIKEETEEILAYYDDERQTGISYSNEDLTIEDLIPNNEMMVTFSNQGYIKRVNTKEYKAQGRGGRGSRGAQNKEEDFTKMIILANNHDYLMFFTDKGRVFWKKVFSIPQSSKTAKGKPIVNVLENLGEESVVKIIKISNFQTEGDYLLMVTKKGILKKTILEAYSRPNRGGIIAINLRDDDELLDVKIANKGNEISLGSSDGMANRFSEDKVREVGRNSIGVKGMNIGETTSVVGMITSSDIQTPVLVISSRGYGKRTLLEEYRKTNRGSKGVKSLNISEKTGNMISIMSAVDNEDLIIITKNGIVIRQHVENIRIMGRNTQGVKLISLGDNDQIADVCILPREEDEEDIIDSQVNLNTDEEENTTDSQGNLNTDNDK